MAKSLQHHKRRYAVSHFGYRCGLIAGTMFFRGYRLELCWFAYKSCIVRSAYVHGLGVKKCYKTIIIFLLNTNHSRSSSQSQSPARESWLRALNFPRHSIIERSLLMTKPGQLQIPYITPFLAPHNFPYFFVPNVDPSLKSRLKSISVAWRMFRDRFFKCHSLPYSTALLTMGS